MVGDVAALRLQLAVMKEKLHQDLVVEVRKQVRDCVRHRVQNKLPEMLQSIFEREVQALPIEGEVMHSNVSWSH